MTDSISNTQFQDIVQKGSLEKLQMALAQQPPASLGIEQMNLALLQTALDGNAKKTKLLLAAGASVHTRDKSRWTPLMRASILGNIETIKVLLSYGSEPNDLNDYERTAMIESAAHGHLEAVKLLHKTGSDLDHWPPKVGGPALAEAAQNNREKVVRFLLKAGANPQVHMPDGKTPLMWASEYNHADIIGTILSAGAEVDKRTKYTRMTALMFAVKRGGLESTRKLVHAGAKMNLKDAGGRSVLGWAVSGSYEVFKWLLDHGMKLPRSESGTQQLLQNAISHGNESMIKLLLNKGLTVQPKNEFGICLLSMAVLNRNPKILRYFLQQSVFLIDYRGKQGKTALMTAARTGNVEAAKLLLEHGANPLIKDQQGLSALHHAAGSGYLELTRLLSIQDADIERKTDGGQTPLSIAARGSDHHSPGSNHFATVCCLIEEGAEIGVSDNRGFTALMYGVIANNLEIVSTLLDHGADVNHMGLNGETSLLTALQYGVENERSPVPEHLKTDPVSDLVDLLLKAGADPNLHGPDKIPLFMALSNRCPQICRQLLEKGANPKAVNANGDTVLMASTGSVKKCRMMLKEGIQVNAKNRQTNTALHLAARSYKENKQILASLIRAKAEINLPGQFGQTPLMMAILPEIKVNICYLLGSGADPMTRNSQGITALEYAEQAGKKLAQQWIQEYLESSQ